ncbi:N-acyl-D-amino-acid deacylase family protein [Alcanivorax sp.]|uniref:N-acyl-D-amino-acid deacylase family protein n=1 Tax=Alcanivorax sp. TaxID=1872427 RepID=UPI003A93D755
MQQYVYDIVINHGQFFDGSCRDGVIRHLGIRDGRVVTISDVPLPLHAAPRVYDATGQWVTPGFIETHSHYDAEVIATPSLKESVRHGVTSVLIGSCSISMINAQPEDCSDLFTRVEAVPREAVLPILKEKKGWHDAAGYRAFYDRQPLGPNVGSFVGHSDIRVAVMGLERATSPEKPSEEELQQMECLLEDALDAGCIGLSLMTTRLDKVDGDRAWSRPLPSTYARWSEFKRLFRILRRRNAVMQGAPDAVKKVNVLRFLWQAHGLFRRPMKCSMLTALDLKSNPWLNVVTRLSGFVANRVLRGNFRWQTLPAPFTLHLSGLNVNAFEEFSSGELLRDYKDEEAMYAKVDEPAFRKLFKKHVNALFTKGLWHRDFSDCWVVDCPDTSLIGKNFEEIGAVEGKDAVDAYFDLAVQYRNELRWKTNYGNHRPEIMHKLLASPYTHVGFADSGAHLESIAQYNFPLRLLKYVRDADEAGLPFMSVAEGVNAVTADLADWFGLRAGHLRVGARADVVIVNPEGLTDELDEVSWAPLEGTSLNRLVKRNDEAVTATIINGRVAYDRVQGFDERLGHERDFGQFLPGTEVQARPSRVESGLQAV